MLTKLSEDFFRGGSEALQGDFSPRMAGAATPIGGNFQVSRIPLRSEATEFEWSAAIARRRGIHGFNSMDARSRSFNLIRGKLVNLRRERQWRMIGFVSAAPSVGKSYVSSNIAASLSRDPRWNTYLVDLDLRRGGVATTFGLDPQVGLETYFEDPSSVGQVPSFAPTGQELVVVPTVPGHLHSAELLASSRASDLLDQMRRSASENLFLFDLPPVFANDDALTIVELLDSYVFVAEEGKTTRREIESAVETLGQERLAGIVLNKYRGGLVSEGRGIEERYASRYYTDSSITSSERNPADTQS